MGRSELFFFLVKKKPTLLPDGENFSPFVNADICTHLFSADVVKKCALIALHLIAEEGRDGEDGCHAPGRGDEWKVGCPQNPMWRVKAKCGLKTEMRPPVALVKAMCALHVIGLHGPGDKISFVLQD